MKVWLLKSGSRHSRLTELRVCVAGAGVMGVHHVVALGSMDDVVVTGVADSSEKRLQQAARGRSLTPYGDIEQMLEAETPDFVIVAVPTNQHEAVALQALDRGAHVLVEKPVASDVGSARRIQKKADDNGLLVSVGHVERFNPAVVALKRAIADGDIGEVFQVSARRTGPFPPRVADVGVIKDLATHDLDVISFVFDCTFDFVFAQQARHLHSTHEDLASVIGRLANGAIAVLDVNWLTPSKVRELRIIGEGGMYVVDYLRQDLTLFRNGGLEPGFDALAEFAGVSEGQVLRHVVARREPLLVELEAFVQAVRSGGPAPVSVEQGIEALLVADAILDSAERGERVTL